MLIFVRYLLWSGHHHVHLVRQRLGPALPERLDVCGNVPGRDVRGRQPCVPHMRWQLRDVPVQWHILSVVHVAAAAGPAHAHVRVVVPVWHLPERHRLRPMPAQRIWTDLPTLQLWPGRCVRPRHPGHRRVHVPNRL